MNGAAIQARIPTALVRKQEGGKISCTSGTMDCVVSVYGFSSGVAAASGKDGAPATVKGLASEVARVLKPGGTVLFVEKGESKELVRDVQPMSSSSSSSLLLLLFLMQIVKSMSVHTLPRLLLPPPPSSIMQADIEGRGGMP